MQNQGNKVQHTCASLPIMNTLIFFFLISNINFLEGLGEGASAWLVPEAHDAASCPCCNHVSSGQASPSVLTLSSPGISHFFKKS